jgi:glutamate racemase
MTKTSEETPPRPMIGIFDSGVGGVTVADAIYRVLPDEDVVYLGDTARVPYGNKSPATVTRFTQDCTRYLMQHFPIKLMVIACNTASATALPHLGDIGVPVLGVIEPGAKAAAAASRKRRVGVIGTRTTIASGVYPAAIKAIAPDIATFGVACPLFVPLAEEGWGETEVARAAAERYLAGLRDADVDVIVLGCTHYPILKQTIQETVGDGIKLVDSAEETAAAARWMLHQRDMLNPAGGVARRRYLLTDEPGEFLNVARRFLRDEGVVAEKVDV